MPLAFRAAAAAALWLVLCVRWFDVAAPMRPTWLAAVPSGVVAAAALSLFAYWLAGAGPVLLGGPTREATRLALGVAGLSLLFRLPLVFQGAAGYVTPDGALSGIVALHARDGVAHHVFVPHVPYSGSFKSHLTAPLAGVMDPAQAFALVSVLFYALFAAGVCRLATLVGPQASWTPLAAGLYVAFAPAFVTRYSLSNDGNYVEVLALGTWALVLALRHRREPGHGGPLAGALGLALGVAFWCHILALIHVAAITLWMFATHARRAVRAAPVAFAGFVLGYFPGVLWNATHGWRSLAYVLPGGPAVGELAAGPSVLQRALLLLIDQLPVLMGYDPGYPLPIDVPMRLLAGVAVVAAIVAAAAAAGGWWRRRPHEDGLGLLLLFALVNLAVALFALPAIPGNPRYLLFLMASLPILLARALGGRAGRVLFAALVMLGAAGSLGQALPTIGADRQWRSLVAGLETAGVRWCYTDFFLATKVNFLSQERVVCSAKLGPTTTEYFFEYREQVERAAEAALIAVNAANAEKLERRLERLGVGYERVDMMKPVLLRLSRKVDPEELFPERAFPLR